MRFIGLLDNTDTVFIELNILAERVVSLPRTRNYMLTTVSGLSITFNANAHLDCTLVHIGV